MRIEQPKIKRCGQEIDEKLRIDSVADLTAGNAASDRGAYRPASDVHDLVLERLRQCSILRHVTDQSREGAADRACKGLHEGSDDGPQILSHMPGVRGGLLTQLVEQRIRNQMSARAPAPIMVALEEPMARATALMETAR
jgi:hypothetical protein